MKKNKEYPNLTTSVLLEVIETKFGLPHVVPADTIEGLQSKLDTFKQCVIDLLTLKTDGIFRDARELQAKCVAQVFIIHNKSFNDMLECFNHPAHARMSDVEKSALRNAYSSLERRYK
jgi:hypothetical protein